MPRCHDARKIQVPGHTLGVSPAKRERLKEEAAKTTFARRPPLQQLTTCQALQPAAVRTPGASVRGDRCFRTTTCVQLRVRTWGWKGTPDSSGRANYKSGPRIRPRIAQAGHAAPSSTTLSPSSRLDGWSGRKQLPGPFGQVHPEEKRWRFSRFAVSFEWAPPILRITFRKAGDNSTVAGHLPGIQSGYEWVEPYPSGVSIGAPARQMV
jgi:hypothetical protein